MSDSIKLNQQEIESIVLEYLKSNHPEFKITDATLETESDGKMVKSWWVACEHDNGDESIMEDDQIMLLIQNKHGWKSISEKQLSDSEQEGFALSLKGN